MCVPVCVFDCVFVCVCVFDCVCVYLCSLEIRNVTSGIRRAKCNESFAILIIFRSWETGRKEVESGDGGVAQPQLGYLPTY